MKITVYVCEEGSTYEGGSTFYVSSSYIDAWKKIREKRIQADCDAIERRNRMGGQLDMMILSKNHSEKDTWHNDCYYFKIISFVVDCPQEKVCKNTSEYTNTAFKAAFDESVAKINRKISDAAKELSQMVLQAEAQRKPTFLDKLKWWFIRRV